VAHVAETGTEAKRAQMEAASLTGRAVPGQERAAGTASRHCPGTRNARLVVSTKFSVSRLSDGTQSRPRNRENQEKALWH